MFRGDCLPYGLCLLLTDRARRWQRQTVQVSVLKLPPSPAVCGICPCCLHCCRRITGGSHIACPPKGRDTSGDMALAHVGTCQHQQAASFYGGRAAARNMHQGCPTTWPRARHVCVSMGTSHAASWLVTKLPLLLLWLCDKLWETHPCLQNDCTAWKVLVSPQLVGFDGRRTSLDEASLQDTALPGEDAQHSSGV